MREDFAKISTLFQSEFAIHPPINRGSSGSQKINSRTKLVETKINWIAIVLKQLAIATSVAACSLIPTKAFAHSSLKAISLSRFSEEIVTHSRSHKSEQFDFKPSAGQLNHFDRLDNVVLGNLNHDIYGITKSIWRKLGINAEIDDGTESIFREYGVLFLLFGGLFGWMIYLSLSNLKRMP
jgi:hypothetical protein